MTLSAELPISDLMVLDTLILQLGCILHTVPAWNRVYRLRVMVFVGYESEVEEERGRVKALLDKLRSESEVHVFWLANGDLATYEFIIHGRCLDIAVEEMVNNVLKSEPWWDDLQALRGQATSMTDSQELTSMANIVESTSGRPGVHNPHDEIWSRRRHSLALQGELTKKPTV